MTFRQTYTEMLPHISGGKSTPGMDKLFPEFYNWATLGQASEKSADEDLAMQAAKVMMMMGGKVPETIQGILKKEE